MTANLRFISVPTADTPGTLLALDFDDKRYLFGQVGEGSQRTCLQRSVNMVKTKALFLSGKIGWKSTGGLTGLSLTLADAVKSHVNAVQEMGVKTSKAHMENLGMTVFGGVGLWHSVASGRKYVFRTGGYVRFRELQHTQEGGKPDYEDGNIKVWAMRIQSDSPEEANNASDEAKIQADSQQMSGEQIVAHMWGSAWKPDALEEVELQHVKLPVTKLWERDPVTKDLMPYHGPLPNSETPLLEPHKKVLVRQPWPTTSIANLPPLKPDGAAISYLLKTQPRRGKFDVNAAQDLKVKKGPAWAALTHGESVLNEDGEVITPNMVLGPEQPGTGILILDVPDSSFIQDLLARLENLAGEIQRVKIAVWILPKSLESHAAVVSFMKSQKHIKHIVASEDICANEITLPTSDRLTSVLKLVLPDNIARPIHADRATSQLVADDIASNVHIRPADVTRQFGIRPLFKIEDLPLTAVMQHQESDKLPSLIEMAQRHNSEHVDFFRKWQSSLAMPDAEVLFLGTGSAVPGLTRNVTGILLRVPGHGNYILDCGENTAGQLKRMLPPDELKQTLRDLRMIWISHLHADHHLGTIGLLKEWYSVVHDRAPLSKPDTAAEFIKSLPATHDTRQRLPIVANSDFHKMLADYAQIEDIGYSRVLPINHRAASVDIDNGTILDPTLLTLMTQLVTKEEAKTPIKDSTLHTQIFGAVDLGCAPVKHCRGSTGLVLTFRPQQSSNQQEIRKTFRVAWSGDCRPSARLAILGQDADLLIHECTFDTGLEGQAEAKAHSTMREAKRVAAAMGAKSLILTHFSQRYSKLPDLTGMALPMEDKKAAMQRLRDTMYENDASGALDDDDGLVEPLDGPDGPDVDVEGEDPITTAGAMHPSKTPTFQSDQEEVVPATSGPSAIIHNGTNHKSFRPSPLPTCAAFDFMHIRIKDIPLMQAYTPALMELFREPPKEKPEPATSEELDAALEVAAEARAERRALARAAHGSDNHGFASAFDDVAMATAKTWGAGSGAARPTPSGASRSTREIKRQKRIESSRERRQEKRMHE